MNPGHEFDVLVVGGGLVGAACALALGQGGLRVGLLESAAPLALPRDDSWDSRIYAVTPGNVSWLRGMGTWDTLEAARIAPIHRMEVWGDDGHSKLEFDAYESGAAELGVIAESRLMLDGLWRQLQACGRVELLCPARPAALEIGADAAVLTLEDGRMLHAKLLVGADGAQSWVRQQAGIEPLFARDYGQWGVVANFACEKPHGNVARQWFSKDGILAWLPLPGDRISMVWSTPEPHARELLALEAQALCAAVAEAGGMALGALQLLTPAAGFPLKLQYNESLIRPRLALIGDAAHRVHPLAGQGVNLGFRDAATLVDTIMADHGRDPGDWLLLRRYERSRKSDILSMQVVTDGLQRLFNNDLPGLGTLRNSGLAAVNRSGWLKKQLMAQAMI
ncbi:MAG TPA: UbiH/UbiF family hydroxylase [Methylophilaceae bacterium]|nr:UbiH/UbiF family hydroxylase [Methylophilaceae bacterium]